VEGPPGIHGVIIEVDLAAARVGSDQCLKMFSLRLVQETVIDTVTEDVVMSEQSVKETSDEEDGQDEAEEKKRAEN
jgi:hypothetical protein